MSDLVGNPEDRFSRVAAHIGFNVQFPGPLAQFFVANVEEELSLDVRKPVFGISDQVPTQSGLYSQRSRLDA